MPHSEHSNEDNHFLVERFRQLVETSTDPQKRMIREIIHEYQYALENADFIPKKAGFYPQQFASFNESQQEEFFKVFIKVQKYVLTAAHDQHTSKSIKLDDDLENAFKELMIMTHLNKAQIETVFENLQFCSLLHKIDLFENQTKIKLKYLSTKQLELIHNLLG
jgi:hypothetical protein